MYQHGSIFYLDHSLPYRACYHSVWWVRCYTYDYFRPLAWHDLAFYNADLYEDLRQMMPDAEQGKKDDDEFMAMYCSYFKVRKKYS